MRPSEVRVVGPCVSYTPSGYESRRRVCRGLYWSVGGRARPSSSRRVLVVLRAGIFYRTLRARPLMAPDVDLRSNAIALRHGRIQPIAMAADYGHDPPRVKAQHQQNKILQ